MTTTVRIYRSTDGSAPSLTGQVGTILTVLDAVLVNGYGTQTQAGWSKPFSNSGNKGCYRNSAVDGTGFYLSIDDSGSGTGGAKEAFCNGFQTMSALSTGTLQFPTSTQLNLGSTPAGSVIARKSNTADATARAWTIIADDTVFYMFIENGDQTSPFGSSCFFFGDFFSYAATDPYKCMIIGRNAVNTVGAGPEWSAGLNGIFATSNNQLAFTLPGHFAAASFSGVGGSILIGKHTDNYKNGGLGVGSVSGTTLMSATTGSLVGGNGSQGLGNIITSGFTYPNPPDGGLYLAPIWIHHSGTLRGYFKGLWCPVQYQPLNHNDTFSGSGLFSGKSFIAQNVQAGFTSAANLVGQYIIETSSTWS